MDEFKHFRRRRQTNLVIAVATSAYAVLCLVSTAMQLAYM